MTAFEISALMIISGFIGVYFILLFPQPIQVSTEEIEVKENAVPIIVENQYPTLKDLHHMIKDYNPDFVFKLLWEDGDYKPDVSELFSVFGLTRLTDIICAGTDGLYLFCSSENTRVNKRVYPVIFNSKKTKKQFELRFNTFNNTAILHKVDDNEYLPAGTKIGNVYSLASMFSQVQ